MLKAYERMGHTHDQINDSLTLDFDTRQKARIKTTTNGGQDIGIFMQRGHPLRVGEVLQTECGQLIKVQGADEPVSTAKAKDWLTFSKVCYHLGNRHTRVQIGELWLRFQPDYVLDELAMKYGLAIDATPAVFEPESGAYDKAGHHHGDDNHNHEH